KEKVLRPHLLPDLNVGTIQGPDRQGAVQGEFHIACAGGLVACRGNLFRQLSCGHDALGKAHVIVGYKDYTELVAHRRVRIDKTSHLMNELDNEFAEPVSGGSLSGK